MSTLAGLFAAALHWQLGALAAAAFWFAVLGLVAIGLLSIGLWRQRRKP